MAEDMDPVCPTCGGGWAVLTSTVSLDDSGRAASSPKAKTIQCDAGHVFDVEWMVVLTGGAQYRVRVGTPVSVPPVRPFQRTSRSCHCGKPIQPGQLYRGTPDAPVHIGC